jgi:putative transposase
MRQAKRLIEERRIEYNIKRPHSSLDYLTPVQLAHARCKPPVFSREL